VRALTHDREKALGFGNLHRDLIRDLALPVLHSQCDVGAPTSGEDATMRVAGRRRAGVTTPGVVEMRGDDEIVEVTFCVFQAGGKGGGWAVVVGTVVVLDVEVGHELVAAG
jgi:hypothetical protein